MKNIKIISLMKERRGYLLTAVLSALFVLIVFPAVQVYFTGGLQNFGVWFAAAPTINLALFILFSILFGLLLSFQIYDWREEVCDVKDKTASASTGGLGVLTAFIIPACPACVSLATFILPAASVMSFSQFITQYGTYLLAGSVLLLILGIFLLGGFEEEKE